MHNNCKDSTLLVLYHKADMLHLCWCHIVYFTAYQEWNFSFLTVTGTVKKLLVSHSWLLIYILWFWWHFHDMWVWLERWASSSWTANTLKVIVYFLIDDYHIRWRWSHLVERDKLFVTGELLNIWIHTAQPCYFSVVNFE